MGQGMTAAAGYEKVENRCAQLFLNPRWETKSGGEISRILASPFAATRYGRSSARRERSLWQALGKNPRSIYQNHGLAGDYGGRRPTPPSIRIACPPNFRVTRRAAR